MKSFNPLMVVFASLLILTSFALNVFAQGTEDMKEWKALRSLLFDRSGNEIRGTNLTERSQKKIITPYEKKSDQSKSSDPKAEAAKKEAEQAKVTAIGLKAGGYSASATAAVLLEKYSANDTIVAMLKSGYSVDSIRAALGKKYGEERVDLMLPEDSAVLVGGEINFNETASDMKEQGSSAEEAAAELSAAFDKDVDNTSKKVFGREGMLSASPGQKEQTLAVALIKAGYSVDEVKKALITEGLDSQTIEKMLPDKEQQGVVRMRVLDNNGDAVGFLVLSTANDKSGAVSYGFMPIDNEAGQIKGMTVFGYDQNGYKVRVLNFDEDGKIVSTAEYKNDTQGRMIEARHYDSKGRIINKITFDANGNELETTVYNSDGSQRARQVNTYDGDGNMVRSDYYDANNNLGGYTLSEYGPEGQMLKDITYDKDGNIVMTTEYTYDMEGMKGKAVAKDKSGNVQGVVEFGWNEFGVTHQIVFDDKGQIKEHSYKAYNDAGQVVKETYFNPDGSKNREVVNVYKNGFLFQQNIYNSAGQLTQSTQYFNSSTWRQNQVGFINYKPEKA